MRKSILLTTVLALVPVAAAILSAQSAQDQLKAYTESAPGQSKTGAPPAAPNEAPRPRNSPISSASASGCLSGTPSPYFRPLTQQ